MPLVTTTSLLAAACEGKYAVLGCNVYNLETIRAVIEAAEEANAPVILQTTPATVRIAGAEELAAVVRESATKSRVPVALHLDHGKDEATILQCLRAGYTSVMYDGSRLTFEENIARTRRIVELAHAVGVPVEGELGPIGGREEGGIDVHPIYTDPDEAARFVKITGVDSLAVAIGTVHGLYQGEPHLDFDRLRRIYERVSVPLVLHGASGLSEALVRRAVANGIRKVNVGTEVKLRAAEAIRKVLVDSNEVDPRRFMEAAKEAIKAVVAEKLAWCGSVNRAPEMWRYLHEADGSEVTKRAGSAR
ncbi:class II fructose-bisphosphate aldolase [Thermaerobacter composti]|uniref:Class II fructose-bisphosphate aldolase n=1 Tax=Thermaerobacter composti TaxID=554949 RepID=A0ABZ0QN98_9FIRM|nr:class II fructose-bisphosphate aldolase [Thermaerobacter composti]WPD18257.1 class II fructose-bisphosphate aldolase [Thermaerobacter composti]